VAARKKKSQKKSSSTSAGRRLTKKQYRANLDDASAILSGAVKAVERLELNLKRIKNKLDCFTHIDYGKCPYPRHKDH
jgi:hypothetical protein